MATQITQLSPKTSRPVELTLLTPIIFAGVRTEKITVRTRLPSDQAPALTLLPQGVMVWNRGENRLIPFQNVANILFEPIEE